MAATVRNVTVFDHNKELSFQPGDEQKNEGSFEYLGVIYTYTTFFRGSLTYLHVYGEQIDRNVYLHYEHDMVTTTKRDDLELATVFLDPPIDHPPSSSSSSESTRGFTPSTVPIMTGVSELESPRRGVITIYEEPQEYHSRLSDYTHQGTHTTPAGNVLHYRALSAPTGGQVMEVKTRVVVREESSGRKLYFTVDRSTFVESEDMAIADQILNGIQHKVVGFKPATNEADLERIIDKYRAAQSKEKQSFSQKFTPISGLAERADTKRATGTTTPPTATPPTPPKTIAEPSNPDAAGSLAGGGAAGAPDSAVVRRVYVTTANEEFTHTPGDGKVYAGSLTFSDWLYVWRAFSRASTSTTYLTVFGVSTERTVRLKIGRGQFQPESDLKAATVFLDMVAPSRGGGTREGGGTSAGGGAGGGTSTDWGAGGGGGGGVVGVLHELVALTRPSSSTTSRPVSSEGRAQHRTVPILTGRAVDDD
jgi:hypothetical protein